MAATTPRRCCPFPPAARCSPPRSRTPSPRRCRASSSRDAIGSTETGFTGIGLVTAGREAARRTDRHAGAGRHRAGSGQPAGGARRGRPAGPGRARPARLLQGPGQDRGHARRGGRETVRRARRPGPGRGRRLRDAARPRQHLRELRRREGLPRGGGGRAEIPPGRLRRTRHRGSGRTARSAGRGAGATAGRAASRPGRDRGARPRADRRVQGAAQHLAGRRHPAHPPARRTTGGRSSTPPPTLRPPAPPAHTTPPPGTRRARASPHDAIMRTPLCHVLGIEHPIVGFTPSEHVAAAISRAGGLGVLGCVRFNDPDELDAVLHWMDTQHRRPAVRRRCGDARHACPPRAPRSTWAA